MNLKSALGWTAFWVSIALVFAGFVFYFMGAEKALEFLAGYVIEFSLSMDNMFLFLMIFTVFQIAPHNQRRVLNWGIFGAVLMRLCFIVAGLTLIRQFEWMLYVFGGILIVTAAKIIFGKEKPIDFDKNPLLRLVRRVLPITSDYHGDKFFVRIDRVLYATPLFVVIVIIESTDLLFAIDSIPAIFAVTTDLFIVYTSNIMAVLGLRSLYFLLQYAQSAFTYVKQGVGIILFFAGVKMLLAIWHIKLPIWLSLSIITGIMATSIIVSLIVGKYGPKKSLPSE